MIEEGRSSGERAKNIKPQTQINKLQTVFSFKLFGTLLGSMASGALILSLILFLVLWFMKFKDQGFLDPLKMYSRCVFPVVGIGMINKRALIQAEAQKIAKEKLSNEEIEKRLGLFLDLYEEILGDLMLERRVVFLDNSAFASTKVPDYTEEVQTRLNEAKHQKSTLVPEKEDDGREEETPS